MMKNINPRDWEALSAYLDGQLAPKERQLLEARLQARADLRLALDELRRTRSVLRARLPVRAPRNFTLTPEMAGIRQRRRSGFSLFSSMRLASALSSVLFVLVALGELLLGGRLTPSTLMVAEQRQPAQSVRATAAVEAAPPEAPAVALQAPAPESAQPTPQVLAKAAGPASATSLPAFAQPIPLITESAPSSGQGLGGGAGGGEDTANQAALSQMAAAATATPLPTPTLTPSATPVPPAEQVANQAVREGIRERLLSERALWRVVELVLALVGVSTGLIAFYMYKAGRS